MFSIGRHLYLTPIFIKQILSILRRILELPLIIGLIGRPARRGSYVTFNRLIPLFPTVRRNIRRLGRIGWFRYSQHPYYWLLIRYYREGLPNRSNYNLYKPLNTLLTSGLSVLLNYPSLDNRLLITVIRYLIANKVVSKTR